MQSLQNEKHPFLLNLLKGQDYGGRRYVSVAAFTAAVPIPGLGTNIGVAVGFGINAILTRDDKTGKLPMGKLGGLFK